MYCLFLVERESILFSKKVSEPTIDRYSLKGFNIIAVVKLDFVYDANNLDNILDVSLILKRGNRQEQIENLKYQGVRLEARRWERWKAKEKVVLSMRKGGGSLKQESKFVFVSPTVLEGVWNMTIEFWNMKNLKLWFEIRKP